MTETHVDLVAALEEGLAPMPAHLIPLRDESNDLKEQIEALTARRDEIKDIFSKTLESNGLQGFLLNGKVHARRSKVTNTRLDAKKLKEEHPLLHAKYVIITQSVRVVIN